MNQNEILQKIKLAYQSILKEKLVGIYVHGSVAFGCFNWDKSDIDFLIVVNQSLSQEEKEALISELIILDVYCPPKGLEMSVVRMEVCKPFVYPTPFELHFSNTHKERCKSDIAGYCRKMNGVDKDLAAHITVINKVGMPLCGKEIHEVFEAVPKEFYMDSILFDIENADQEIEENPVYFILNLCRVSAYLENDLVLSKKQGGEWGIENLPAEYGTLIEKAMDSYQSDVDFAEDYAMYGFVDYMLQRTKKRGRY